MPEQKGKFIVIEGTDGSGKTVQFNKLVERLKKEGHNVASFDFPQYDKPSSYFVKEYLNGRYGGWKEIGPYKASLFYALDRFDAGSRIKEALRQGKIVVSNRYVASNMGHQGAKINSKKEQMKFLKWLDGLEYGILGIPRPDINIVLHVPAEIAQKLVDKKGRREYIGGIKRDIHEQDLKHLRQAEQTYLEIVRAFPENFYLIECIKRGKLLSVDEIHKKIWQAVQVVLI